MLHRNALVCGVVVLSILIVISSIDLATKMLCLDLHGEMLFQHPVTFYPSFLSDSVSSCLIRKSALNVNHAQRVDYVVRPPGVIVPPPILPLTLLLVLALLLLLQRRQYTYTTQFSHVNS